MTVLQGRLADRAAWSAVGECPVEKTMALLGTKSAMLIMREAYYGTTRFDDFWRRVGVTKAAASARLSELVEAGLLERRPYQEPGQRSRDEYVLTDAGTDFMPVVWAMFEWGRRHLPNRSPLRLAHARLRGRGERGDSLRQRTSCAARRADRACRQELAFRDDASAVSGNRLLAGRPFQVATGDGCARLGFTSAAFAG